MLPNGFDVPATVELFVFGYGWVLCSGKRLTRQERKQQDRQQT